MSKKLVIINFLISPLIPFRRINFTTFLFVVVWFLGKYHKCIDKASYLN